MRLPRVLRHIHYHHFVRELEGNKYFECRCGKRAVVSNQTTRGRTPVDRAWLAGGQFQTATGQLRAQRSAPPAQRVAAPARRPSAEPRTGLMPRIPPPPPPSGRHSR